MPDETLSSMHDARDAEDKRLLEAGDYRQLLENYFYLVEEWASIRMRDPDAADEVTQLALLRLQEELTRGRRYRIPFRVVAWNVVRWTAAGYYRRSRHEVGLPENWDLPDEGDMLEEWMAEQDARGYLATLPEGQRAAAELVHIEGLSHEQAAERLGITRNALDQRLHNAHRNLAEKLVA